MRADSEIYAEDVMGFRTTTRIIPNTTHAIFPEHLHHRTHLRLIDGEGYRQNILNDLSRFSCDILSGVGTMKYWVFYTPEYGSGKTAEEENGRSDRSGGPVCE